MTTDEVVIRASIRHAAEAEVRASEAERIIVTFILTTVSLTLCELGDRLPAKSRIAACACVGPAVGKSMWACPWQRRIPAAAYRFDWRRLLALTCVVVLLIVGFSSTIFCEAVTSTGERELGVSALNDSSQSPQKSAPSITYCHSCTMIAIVTKVPPNTIAPVESKQLALRLGSIRPHRPPTETRPPIAL